MRLHSLFVSSLCVGCIALAFAPSAQASRGSSFGESPVIVWDGEKDVVVSQGEGQSQTLADRHLANLADFAVRAVGSVQFSSDPLTPTTMNFVRLLLWPKGLAEKCALPLNQRPSLCSRVTTLKQAMGGPARFYGKNFQIPGSGQTLPFDVVDQQLAPILTIAF